MRAIFEHFDLAATVERLHRAKLLYLVTEKFARIDLHPSRVDNVQMGLVFEELIRKFAFISNPDEEARLRDETHQDRLVEALHTGIRRYFARNTPLARQRSL